MPLGSVGYENAGNENGERYIWLEPNAVNRLRALRDPGENYSDVILRLAGRAALRSKLGRVIRRSPRRSEQPQCAIDVIPICGEGPPTAAYLLGAQTS